MPKVEYAVVIYNFVGSSDDLLQATFVDGSSWLVAVPVADSSQPKISFSMMTSVQLCRRPIRWVTLYVPVFLFYFFGVTRPGLWCFQEEDITLFLLMLQYVCFLWRINMARGLTNNKIISTVEFITTLCKLLLSFRHYLAALLLCRGHIFAHFVSLSPIKPWCFINITESFIQWELHLFECVAL